ncbi:hypothetical protein D0Y65_054488 [Glycine soja]|uniref:Uncharacterized protein n=1 Tax=Glycine soja TaxID=3848 RepID=A0A445F6W3_GLYSO|nr:hypothetical protein glysoja_000534 [Glycine soja]RZB44572.1 hypothetical protein D0Y65_054488 [Glycine soja]
MVGSYPSHICCNLLFSNLCIFNCLYLYTDRHRHNTHTIFYILDIKGVHVLVSMSMLHRPLHWSCDVKDLKRNDSVRDLERSDCSGAIALEIWRGATSLEI